MKFRFCFLFIIITGLTIVMTGCWDLRDIDNRAIVLAIAIDYADLAKPDDYLNSDKIKVTAEIAIAEKQAGGGGQAPPMGKDTVWNVSANGDNFSEALEHIQQRLKDKIFLGHQRVLIISQEVARQGVNRYLNYFRNNPEFRRLSYLIISEKKAVDIMETYPKSAIMPGLFLMKEIETAIENGKVPDVPIISFVTRIIDKGQDPVTLFVTQEKDMVRIKGLAVFKGDKMVGILDNYEAFNYLALSEGRVGGLEIVRDVETELGKVAIKVNRVERAVRPVNKNGSLYFEIEVKMEANAISQEAQTDYTEPKRLNQLENRLALETKKELEEIIYKAQHKFQTDIFGLGEKVRAYLPGEWRRIKNWRKEFAQVKLELMVEAKIRRTGMSTFKQK